MLDPARYVVPLKPHPFDGLSSPQDTDSMKELRERNRNRNQTEDVTVVPDSEPEPEEIEQFSDPTLGLPRKRKLSQPPSHRVRDAVQVLELQRKHQEKPVQRLDLKTVNSVAGKMKPKSLPVRNLCSSISFRELNSRPSQDLSKTTGQSPKSILSMILLPHLV